MRTWALPEHIEDLLPAEAARLERMRRIALDRFEVHGYQLVVPPLLEYVESLLSGTGHDMDLATFKLVDQLSGRMIGLRADTTPQVARIDAHILNRQGVSRLCYAGSVLHTRPVGLGKSRQPFQVGAELYGHAGLEADLEILALTLDVLAALEVDGVTVDIGQPAVFRALVKSAALDAELAEQVFHAIENKDQPALYELAPRLGALAPAFAALARLSGGAEVLEQARAQLPSDPAIAAALEPLAQLLAHFSALGVQLSIDLAELGGFNYESGLTFAAYAAGAADAVARGGRYDEVGKAFGRARAATGFSMDLKSLLPLVPPADLPKAILAPATVDAAARTAIAALRAQGHIVIARLPGHEAHVTELSCDRELVLKDGAWQVVPLK
ncbi:MAG: ATP phosphoribosyltransferase regulatory subunit [Betaproteobacteria bacterium]|nr:ATP phosphoribosyltransferase regulatory subunit [Betaproteobacteria bacterium]